MNKKMLFIGLGMTICIDVKATVYKCVDEQGTIHYQSIACSKDEQENIMDKVKVDSEVVLYKTEIQRQSASQAASDKANQQVCQSFQAKYKQIKQQVKQRCVRNRELFCDLSADDIAEIFHKRDLEQYNQVASGATAKTSAGHFNKPPLLQIKDKLESLGCEQ